MNFIKYKLLTENQINFIENKKFSLSELEKKQFIYSKAFYDKEFFSDFFLSHWKEKNGKMIKTPFYHKEIWENLEKDEDLNVIIARWHGKTTSLLIDILHSLLYRKYWSQLYIAATWLWEESIWKIKQELETNIFIKEIFWNLIPQSDKKTRETFWEKKWRQRHLELLNWESIETITKWQSIRWKRPKRIIVDDFDENKDVLNKSQVEKHRTWFLTSLYNTLLPWWKVAVLWTIVWEMCLVKYLRDKKKWKTLEYKAIENWKPIWEEMWSLKSLEERKLWKIFLENWKEIRRWWIWTALFNQEFMNIPISREARIIKDYWLMPHILTGPWDRVIMSIDPATGVKEQNDFTWVVVCWIIWTKIYELYSVALKLSPNKLLETILKIFEKFKPDFVIKEANKEAKLAEDLRLKWVPLWDLWTSKDKVTRLQSIAWLVETWFCYFRYNTSENETLIEQLTNFPEVEHDDVMDAWMLIAENAQRDFISEELWAEEVIVFWR